MHFATVLVHTQVRVITHFASAKYKTVPVETKKA